jgi:tRNA(Ile)-lysidine synthase
MEYIVAALPPLVRKVGRCLRRLQVSQEGIVVAVSGGPDSVALLRLLAELRRGDGLTVAHLNHQLRGAESDQDELFVERLAAKLGLAARCWRIDVAALARTAGDNLEAAARRARYQWLVQVARETGSRWVATGHTADDQAETVLHRLLRGAGLKGLRGIAARRRVSEGVELVRPLLHVRREEVITYLEAEMQEARIDSSNTDRAFTRNRIRYELLPLLAERFNSQIVPVLCRLARQADESYRVEEERARTLLAEAERPRAGRMLVLDRKLLAAAPRHLVREVFRLLWQREGWSESRMSFDAWDRLAGVACGELGGVDLPGGIRVLAQERVVQIVAHP